MHLFSSGIFRGFLVSVNFAFGFKFFRVLKFIITTFVHYPFRSQERLSQINVIVWMHLKFIFYTLFIEGVFRMNFLFIGVFCQKMLAPKVQKLLDMLNEICL